MLKSHKKGYLSAILNLEPAFNYRGLNTCPNAGQCKGLCLKGSGRNRFDMAKASRVRKTKLYVDNRKEFYSLLCKDLEALERKAARENLIPTMRLNGLSDIAFENDEVYRGQNIFEMFPEIQFIDYTKRYTRMFSPLPSNYHLTYSINELTPIGIVDSVMIDSRFNCAAVFLDSIPHSFEHYGTRYPVTPGDDHDLRMLDRRGHIIGLRYKLSFHPKTSKAIRPKNSGFIILP